MNIIKVTQNNIRKLYLNKSPKILNLQLKRCYIYLTLGMRIITFIISFIFAISIQAADKPKLIVQNGHTQGIKSVAISPDNKILASCGEVIKLWDIESGKEINTLSGHSKAVTGLAFNKKGTLLASGSWDGYLILWNVKDGSVRKKINIKSTAFNIFFNEKEDIIISNGNANLRLWNIQSGKEITDRKEDIQELPSDEKTVKNRILRYSTDGKYLCEVKKTSKTKLSQGTSSSSENLYQIGSPQSAVSPDKETIAVTHHREIEFFDIESGELKFTLKGHDGLISSIAFSPDGDFLVSSADDSLIILWNIGSEKEVFRLKGHTGAINRAAISKYIVSASEDRTAKLWDLKTGKLLKTFEGHSAKIFDVSFSPDMSSLAVGSYDNKIKIFELSSGRTKLLSGHYNVVEAVAYSPDGKTLASGSRHNTIRLWNTEDYNNFNTILGHNDDISKICFADNGNLLLSLSKDGELRLWNTKTSYMIRKFSDNTTGNSSMAVSPDGLLVAAGQGNRATDVAVNMYNVLSGDLERKFYWRGSRINALSFSRNGSQLAAASAYGDINIWDVKSGHRIANLNAHSDIVHDMDYSSDGKVFASAGSDGYIKLWDTEKWQLRDSLFHEAEVTSIDFSTDGKILAGGSADGRIKIWDVERGILLATLISLNEDDWAVISPNGKFDASNGGMELLHYVQNNRPVPLGAFFEKLYVPGLLEDIFALGRAPAIETPIDLQNRIKMPPSIKFLSPGLTQTFSEKDVNVSVEISDEGGGIDEVRLFQNGKLVEERPLSLKPKRGNKSVQDFEISLLPGMNIISITAVNSERTENRKDYALEYISSKAPSLLASSDMYIFTVGINEYENSSYNLNYGRPDALAFGEKLGKGAEQIYGNIYRYELYDNQAVKKNIDSVFRQIIANSKPSDTFIFYYAGHGKIINEDIPAQSEYYLILHDITRMYSNTEEFDKKGISANNLKEYCRKVKAQKQMVVLDACHSGSAVEQFAVRGSIEEKAIMQLSRSAGIVILASSGSEQVAIEFSHLGHGVFTYALIKGMSGDADNGDGKLTVRELDSYLNDKVPELTRKFRSRKQYPNSRAEGNDFPIVIIE